MTELAIDIEEVDSLQRLYIREKRQVKIRYSDESEPAVWAVEVKLNGFWLASFVSLDDALIFSGAYELPVVNVE